MARNAYLTYRSQFNELWVTHDPASGEVFSVALVNKCRGPIYAVIVDRFRVEPDLQFTAESGKSVTRQLPKAMYYTTIGPRDAVQVQGNFFGKILSPRSSKHKRPQDILRIEQKSGGGITIVKKAVIR